MCDASPSTPALCALSNLYDLIAPGAPSLRTGVVAVPLAAAARRLGRRRRRRHGTPDPLHGTMHKQ